MTPRARPDPAVGPEVPVGPAHGGADRPHPVAADSWVPRAPCTPEACTDDGRPPVAVPLRLLRCAACLAAVAVGVAGLPAVRLLPGRSRDRVVGAWARSVVGALGVRIRAEGAASAEKSVLVVANHVSWLDIPALAAVRPVRMVAKREVGAWPLVGRLIAAAGTLFVSRDAPRRLPADVAALTRTLATGSAAVFPEGSTWCGARHGAFRRAVFQAALDAGAAVQPVAIAYRDREGRPVRAAAFVGDDTLAASLWRISGIPACTAVVRPGPVIPAGRYADRRALAAAAAAWSFADDADRA